MRDVEAWWKGRSTAAVAIYTVAYLALISVGGIDIGRALYDATH